MKKLIVFLVLVAVMSFMFCSQKTDPMVRSAIETALTNSDMQTAYHKIAFLLDDVAEDDTIWARDSCCYYCNRSITVYNRAINPIRLDSGGVSK